MSEIDISKYFKTYRNDDGFLFAIETIGDERELIKEIRKQNEELHKLKAEKEELKKGVMSKCPQCGEIYLNNVACEIYEKIYEYKQCIDDIKKIILKYKLLDSNIFMSIPIPDTKKIFEILEKNKGK